MYKRKYNEDIITTSISMPLSLKKKIEEKVAEFGINKNALTVIYILNGVELTEQEINKLQEKKNEMYNIDREKEKIEAEHKKEQDKLILSIIKEAIKTRHDRFIAILREQSLSSVIKNWINALEAEIKTNLISNGLEDADYNLIKRKVEVELIKAYSDRGEIIRE